MFTYLPFISPFGDAILPITMQLECGAPLYLPFVSPPAVLGYLPGCTVSPLHLGACGLGLVSAVLPFLPACLLHYLPAYLHHLPPAFTCRYLLGTLLPGCHLRAIPPGSGCRFHHCLLVLCFVGAPFLDYQIVLPACILGGDFCLPAFHLGLPFSFTPSFISLPPAISFHSTTTIHWSLTTIRPLDSILPFHFTIPHLHHFIRFTSPLSCDHSLLWVFLDYHSDRSFVEFHSFDTIGRRRNSTCYHLHSRFILFSAFWAHSVGTTACRLQITSYLPLQMGCSTVVPDTTGPPFLVILVTGSFLECISGFCTIFWSLWEVMPTCLPPVHHFLFCIPA